MPAATQGKTRKFARPYHGPYRVKEASEQGVVVQPIDNPRGKEIRVSLARVRCCPTQLGDEFWPKKVKQPTTEMTWNRLRRVCGLGGCETGRGRPDLRVGNCDALNFWTIIY